MADFLTDVKKAHGDGATSKPLHEDIDAARWAKEYVALHGGDEGLMLSWFANAIMAGYDRAKRTQSALSETAMRGECHDAAEKQMGCFRAVKAERERDEALARVSATAQRMNEATYRNALDRAAYALFQLKRFAHMPKEAIEFCREAHAEACKALDELSASDGGGYCVIVPMDEAKLIRALMPLNPNKTRGWDAGLLAAVRKFIAAVEGK